MKLKWIPWLLLAAFFIMQVITNVELLQLNQLAVQTSKIHLGLDSFKSISIFTTDDPFVVCHQDWLKFIHFPIDPHQDLSAASKMVNCSNIHMTMLGKMYPFNLPLAEVALDEYPNYPFAIYWYIQSSDPSISAKSKSLIETLIDINHNDGLAWRYLGIIHLKEGNKSKAIEAQINSCLNGDPGGNGCYPAARLLEQEGRFKEAIYYYRSSNNELYRSNADRLEIELGIEQ